jgi:hypothetical protein
MELEEEEANCYNVTWRTFPIIGIKFDVIIGEYKQKRKSEVRFFYYKKRNTIGQFTIMPAEP